MDISDAKWEEEGRVMFLRLPNGHALAGYHEYEGRVTLHVLDKLNNPTETNVAVHICDSPEEAVTLAETVLRLTLDPWRE